MAKANKKKRIIPKRQRLILNITLTVLIVGIIAAGIVLLTKGGSDVLSPIGGQMTDIQKPVSPEDIVDLDIPGFEDATVGENVGGTDGEGQSAGMTLPYAIGDTGLKITRLGKYTGTYMEDGSDTMIVGCLMIVVTNESENDVQLMELRLTDGTDTFEFRLTSLPAGKSVMVLEKQGKRFSQEASYDLDAVTAYALYHDEISLHSDVFRIKAADGKLSVENISGRDISGDIYVYYKSSDMGIFIGGITYRARISDLGDGEEKTVETKHFLKDSSVILFVTYNDAN